MNIANKKSIYCKDPIENIQNYQQAKEESFQGWQIHHKMEIWPDGTRMSRQELIDKKLYYSRPASELIFLRREQHISLHNSHPHTKRHNKKLSEAVKEARAARAGKLVLAQHQSGEVQVFLNASQFALFAGISKQWANRCIATGNLANGWKLKLIRTFEAGDIA